MSSSKLRSRLVKASITVLATASLLLGLNPQMASASAGGINGVIRIWVNGHANRVDYVDATSITNGVWRGHVWFHDSKTGLSVNTPVITWYNGTTYRLTLNRNFPTGDRMCITAYDTQLHDIGYPCETIG